MIRIVAAASPDQWQAARRLLEHYQASLDFALDFQDFGHELETLQGEYGDPDGVFLLAEDGDTPMGCVALRRFSQDACEMKRLFTLPAASHQGLGRKLAEAVIAVAKERGYRRMLLDTVPSMAAAQRLYAQLGFVPREAYRYNPVEGTVFMELVL